MKTHPNTPITGLRLVAPVLLGLCAAIVPSHAEDVYTADFSQATAAGWFGSAATPRYDQNIGVGFKAAEASNRHNLVYFDKTTIAVGETLTATFTFTVDTDTTTEANNLHQFSFGLFDSNGGGHVNKSVHGTAGKTNPPNGLGGSGFDPYIGYFGTATFSNVANNTGLFERDSVKAAGKGLLTDSASSYTSFTTQTDTNNKRMYLKADETYTVSFSLKYVSDDEMDLRVDISGKDANDALFSYFVTATDSSSLVTSFDTFAVGIKNSAVVYTVTSLNITVIPEPASAAGCFGIGALAFLVLRRRVRGSKSKA